MNQMLTSFADYLYNRLPSVYRTSDRQEILRRFVEIFAEGGFNPLMQESMAIMDLIDIDKCPSKFLPQLCRMYGYEYTKEIPELFQRRLLKYIVELYKRKGTKSSIKFIARELTGFESEIIENKDFSEEDIELTKWDKRFEHYRNFILKLTAPYEDSLLFNKEEIVVKIINDFLPTNSNMFVITSYWFQDSMNATDRTVEGETLTKVLDPHLDTSNVMQLSDYSLSSALKSIDEYTYHWTGEEDSYLNQFPYLPLTTNTVLNVRDTVRYHTEYYSNFLRYDTPVDSSKSIYSEGDYVRDLESTKQEETKFKVNLGVIDFSSNTCKDSTCEITSDHLILNVENEIAEIVKALIELESTFKTKSKEKEEIYTEGRITHTHCDIIGTNTECVHTTPLKILSQEATKLNLSSVLTTNAIHGWDIVKEVGKTDTILIY